ARALRPHRRGDGARRRRDREGRRRLCGRHRDRCREENVPGIGSMKYKRHPYQKAALSRASQQKGRVFTIWTTLNQPLAITLIGSILLGSFVAIRDTAASCNAEYDRIRRELSELTLEVFLRETNILRNIAIDGHFGSIRIFAVSMEDGDAIAD